MSPQRVVIVGGGVAGLALAEALQHGTSGGEPLDLVVLEKSDRAGGNIWTDRLEGFTCERGPNGFLDSAPDTLALVRRLGLAPRLLASDDAARRRFIYRRGRLHLVPTTPWEFARSRLLSWRGKLRLLLEPFASKRPAGDESIHAFASRRIGVEAAEALIDPLVSGIFAGDARRLSLRAAFPKMWQMETEHGGLVRALLRGRARRRAERGATDAPTSGGAPGAPAGRLTSFPGGIEELVKGLVAALPGSVLTKARATRVREAAPAASSGRFRVSVDGRGTIDADAVVLTGPARESADILEDLDAGLADELRAIATAPLAVVCLGYDAAALARSGTACTQGRRVLDGFGFLVPGGEHSRILGALWDSSVFPGRAPSGRALIRVMLGGARDPQVVSLPDAALIDIARQELENKMRLVVAPLFVQVYRHPVGIPQYTAGHLDRLARIEARLQVHAGIFLGGNSYRGTAINACISDAGPLADAVIAHLRSWPPEPADRPPATTYA